MKKNDFGIQLAATDLAHHLACGHLTVLEKRAAEGDLERPYRDDPALQLLIQRGIDHEKAYVSHLRQQCLGVTELRAHEGIDAIKRTQTAMRAGVGVIVQPALVDDRWSGRLDILLRVALPSDLGDWSYEAADTKLGRQTKGEAVLQLALYNDLLARAQGVRAEYFHVIKPSRENDTPFDQETFRCADFDAFCRRTRQRLEEVVDRDSADATYPDPVAHCDVCVWWSRCDRRRRDDDHLSLVAGLGSLHREELHRQGISTLEGFGERDRALDERPKRGSVETFERLHGQARVQLKGRRAEAPTYELLPTEAGRGLARLPEPGPGDVFFDIESDRFYENKGLEYLLGYAVVDDDGELVYRAMWAQSPEEERKNFVEFIDFLMKRWERYAGMCVYHFSPYEPAALKRLMGHHGACEDDLDKLLRGKRFIDLHTATKEGLRASVESYSLKALEPFFEFERTIDLRDARVALRRVECALEMHAPEGISDEDQTIVAGYNLEDCVSTLRLRDWLERRRTESMEAGALIDRPELESGKASEGIEERRQEVQQVYDQLVGGLPEDRDSWNEDQRGRFLLAQLLDYYRRETKSAWWEYFRLHDLDDEDLLYERKAVTRLEYLEPIEGGTARCPVHRYQFPDQEAAFDAGDSLEIAGTQSKVGTVFAIDQAQRWLDIKKRQDSHGVHPNSVITFSSVPIKGLEASLLALAHSVVEQDLDGDGPYRAARDLLLRRSPRIPDTEHREGDPLKRPDETAVEAAIRLAPLLRYGCLPIQGPPGAGKTHTGAELIASLVAQGKRVGVTAVSHKVIRNLLQEAISAGAADGLEAVHKPGSKDREDETDRLKHIRTAAQGLAALDEGKVVGGTCFMWASNDWEEQLDYLFIDEAGQLSLAMMLAAGRAAKNLILLGDPQQLEQPQQGSHPEGTNASALEHLLNGRQTIHEARGLFLEETWRLHPEISKFTSEMYYEGRLRSRDGLESQTIDGSTRFRGSGLFFEGVDHDGNQNRSSEEAERVRQIADDLLHANTHWVDDKSARHKLTRNDVLVIAPYNAQVGALVEALPEGIRVGTVDKFQGQQAPVVIYSMTSSSARDAPRGMSFLLDPHRLNVATSRARCACIIVGSPRLLEPDCRTPDQMRWANGLCRYVELAVRV